LAERRSGRYGSLATVARVDPDFRALKVRELALKCERLAVALARERGDYIEKAVLVPALRNVAPHQRAVLQRKLEQELPARLAGRTEGEIQQELQRTVDDLCAIHREGMQQWLDAPPQ
jgi:hypothetical protein